METLASILQIEQDVRQAQSEHGVEFIAANDTWRILPYRQAALWRNDPMGKPHVRTVSGLADLEGDSPYRQWLENSIRHVAATLQPGKPILLRKEDFPDEIRDGWPEWMQEVVVAVSLPSPDGSSPGGLWIAPDQAPGEAGFALLERLSWAYGQGLWAWRPAHPAWAGWRRQIMQRPRRIWAGIAVLALVPMRLTVLAPAEITGKDALLIGSPTDGVVEKFFVKPNQAVKAGHPIFALEDTIVRNRNEVAIQSLAVAQADYFKESQESFSNNTSKAELPIYGAKFKEKAAEEEYSADLLKRLIVKAPQEGIVVFSDPNDWLGRPVQTGERIVQLADPRKVEISISLPVDDALDLKPGSGVKLYLNTSPFSPLSGKLTQYSYQPAPVPEGFIAYRLKADLDGDAPVPRIGLKGSAKLYGSWRPLIYIVLRKPLSILRRTIGI